ncbi:MAG: DUF3343 domain-containing protein [Dehalococcoidia bacterium]
MNGLITFYSWHHAMRAEKVLGRNGFIVRLIPTPRDLSSNCGTALRFSYSRRDEALQVLADSRVRIEATYPYVPELDVEAMEDGARRPLKTRLRSWLLQALGARP